VCGWVVGWLSCLFVRFGFVVGGQDGAHMGCL